MNQAGKVITFYSYKGGTGRTMALSNVAVLLARKGHGKVLMVDWDLEAPGLHDFFPAVSLGSDSHHSQRGVLELFESIWANAQGQFDESAAMNEVWDGMKLQDHVVETGIPALDLMPAGRLDREYEGRVGSIPWQDLYLRSPALFKSFSETLAQRYNYVLIDSRTGLTDAGDVCSTLLPDHLVLVFTPNHQSLKGVVDVGRRAISYRSRSTDLRPLLVYPLASRVDTSEDELRKEWRLGGEQAGGYQPRFEALFQEVYDLSSCDLTSYFDEIQIQHVPRYAYGEQIAVEDDHADRLSIARSYEQFADALVQGSSPWSFARQPPLKPGSEDPEHLLRRIREDCEAHWHVAARQRKRNSRMVAAEVISVVGAAVVAFAIWFSAQVAAEEFISVSNELLPILAIGGILAGGLEFLRRELAFDKKGAVHARTANALDRERTLFEGGAGVYSRTRHPLRLLAERYGQIKMQAEDALIEQGSTVEIGRLQVREKDRT